MRLTHVPMLMAICGLVIFVPFPSNAQCPWEGPPVSHNYTVTLFWDRDLQGSLFCNQTAIDNPILNGCRPGTSGMTVMYLRAFFSGYGDSADYCQWRCVGTIGTQMVDESCRIRLGDGLPIELLDFDIISRTVTDPESDSRDAQESDAPKGHELLARDGDR